LVLIYLSVLLWFCCLRGRADDRFLIGPGEVCHWGHRMTNTRDHAEIEEIRKVLKLDEKKGEKEEVEGNDVESAGGSEMPKQEP
jgi:hypothetical protein